MGQPHDPVSEKENRAEADQHPCAADAGPLVGTASGHHLTSFQYAAFKRQAITENKPRNISTHTPSWVR